MVGLIGANGAGRTRTIEFFLDLRRPDNGTVRVFGVDPGGEPYRLRALVGAQLQSASLPDRSRVGDALDLSGGRDGEELLGAFT
jgi:ABC-2 type transport system ATP-binding protein